jgi:hypothetical protein
MAVMVKVSSNLLDQLIHQYISEKILIKGNKTDWIHHIGIMQKDKQGSYIRQKKLSTLNHTGYCKYYKL